MTELGILGLNLSLYLRTEMTEDFNYQMLCYYTLFS